MKDLLINEGFLRAWEAIHGDPTPLTEQERAQTTKPRVGPYARRTKGTT